MKPSSTALLLGILFIFSTIGYSQDAPDTNALRMLVQQGESYFFSNPDSCLLLAEQASVLAKKLDNPRSELRALIMSGEALRMKGEYSQALEKQLKALEIARKMGDKIGEGGTMSLIGWIYVELYEYRQGLNQMFAASEIYKLNPEPGSDNCTMVK